MEILSEKSNRLSNTYRLQSRRTYTSISINKREYYFCVISEQMDKVVSFQEVYHRYEP